MSIQGTPTSGIRWLVDSTGAIVGYRNPLSDKDAMPASGATIAAADLPTAGIEAGTILRDPATGLIYGQSDGAGGYLPLGGDANPKFGRADTLTLDAGSAAYTGPAHFALDPRGVWRYRPANVPPMTGAVLTVNWLDYASNPAQWSGVGSGTGIVGAPTAGQSNWGPVADTDIDGEPVTAMASYNNASRDGPSISSVTQFPLDLSVAPPPLWWPGAISIVSFDVKRVSGSQPGSVYHRPIDAATQPTESRGGFYTAPGAWRRMTHAMQMNSMQYGLKFTPAPQANDTGETRLANVQLELASGTGVDAFASSAFVPNTGAGPAWRYARNYNGNTRGGSAAPANTTDVLVTGVGAIDSCVGPVTRAVGPAIGADAQKGGLQEPAVTNLCDADNYLFGVGWGKASSTGPYTATPPFQSSPSTPAEALRYECASMQRNDYGGSSTIAMVRGSPDTITDSASKFLFHGWKAGDAFWVWRANGLADGGVFGPFTIASVAAGTLTLTSSLGIAASLAASASAKMRLMRCPKVGDQVLMLLNNGGAHRTTTTSLVLPAYNPAWADKDVVRCALAANPPSDGGWAGTDNGVHFFYWTDHTDFGITLSATTTFDVVYARESLRAAGLDELAPHGLAMEFTTGATSPAYIDFGAAAGAGARDTIVSAFARKISGGTCNITLQAHGSSNAAVTNTGWARVRTAPFASAAAGFKASFTNYGAGTKLQVIGMQFEQSAVSTAGSCPWTTPIVNARNGSGATRAAKRWTWPWGTTQTMPDGATVIAYKKNNFGLRLDFTPTAPLPGVTQCLWSVGDTTNGASMLLGGAAGDTWTWRKTVAGANTDVTLTLLPVAGTTYSVAADMSASAGMTLSVSGNAATPNTTTAGKADIAALTHTTAVDLGSALGSAVAAFGALRKTPGAALLWG